ncbi:MAG: hypothetical protein ACYTEQ_07720 [Planctomycetota bacterium]|jgi:hypothetical protein
MLPNKKKKLNIFILLTALALGLTVVVQAEPMGTAFTYQGRLMDKNKPADGLYSFQFRLYDSNDPCTGTPLGSPIDINDLEISDGHFVTELDFGSGIFDGNAVWLETRVVHSPLGSDPCSLRPLLELTPTPYALYAETSGGDSDWTISGNDMYSAVSGNVGIGTRYPGYPLTVEGTVSAYQPFGAAGSCLRACRRVSADPLVVFHDTEIDGSSINSYWRSAHTVGTALKLNDDSAGDVLLAQGGGNVGIGTASPSAKLACVASSGNAVRGEASGEYGHAGVFVASGTYGKGIWAKGPHYAADLQGKVIIRDYSTADPVMELGAGLDYAEGFDVSDKGEIQPGSVLVIDADNPGKLAISDEAYSSKVAGIVAGGKGRGSGVRLGAGGFDFDVALAGRVYCNVEATEVGVEPGDLLTTSATPGYAMKATDYVRAQGAILGKAMEKLEKGEKGQILVLVTLQ